VSRIWFPTLVAGLLALRLAAAAAGPPDPRAMPAPAMPAPAMPAPARPAAIRPAAERLPIRVYTVDDGLAGDEINAVLQDSRGFLWIATDSGLSRFDGTRFAGYDPRQGLPSPNVTTLLEDPSGGLLVGTTGGLARLDPLPTTTERIFSAPPVADPHGRLRHRIAALLTENGALWAADPAPDGGLFRLGPAAGGAGGGGAAASPAPLWAGPSSRR
jgi:hypothetical protein